MLTMSSPATAQRNTGPSFMRSTAINFCRHESMTSLTPDARAESESKSDRHFMAAAGESERHATVDRPSPVVAAQEVSRACDKPRRGSLSTSVPGVYRLGVVITPRVVIKDVIIISVSGV